MDNNFNHNRKQEPFNDSSLCNTTMSRTFSEYDFEELFKQSIGGTDSDHRSHPPAGGIFSGADGCSQDLTAAQYRNPDNLNRFSHCGGITRNPLWSQNPTPKNSSVTMTMDSQSSICAESPTSDIKPSRRDNNVIAATSDDEQSDDDDTEIEAGQCEQSNDQMDFKRINRMVSNRESARIEKKKQAHLTFSTTTAYPYVP